MKKIINKKGLTLVELILGIAIFGILSVGFLNVFFGSLLITTISGERTDTVANVSSEIEKKLSDHTYTSDTIPTVPSQVTIKYNGGADQDIMDGELIQGTEVNENGQTIEITAFIPEE